MDEQPQHRTVMLKVTEDMDRARQCPDYYRDETQWPKIKGHELEFCLTPIDMPALECPLKKWILSPAGMTQLGALTGEKIFRPHYACEHYLDVD